MVFLCDVADLIVIVTYVFTKTMTVTTENIERSDILT